MNPDLLYVQCDKCDGWYHIECIGISREEVEAIEQYFCSSCKSPPKPVAKELNVQIQKKKNQKQNQSSSQSILNYFKRSRDNSSNASPIRINSNVLDNESFKNEIQNSIFSQSTATNSTHKAENTSLSHIFDNISQGTHKTPTKDFESFISQEDKTSMRIELQPPQEENEISEKKSDLGPKSDLNMELQDDWIKEINNVSSGNIFNEGFIEKSDEMQEIHVALDL